jgi:hypothetical protein
MFAGIATTSVSDRGRRDRRLLVARDHHRRRGLIVGVTPRWRRLAVGDALENRRGDRAAGVAADARRIDHHDDRQRGLRDGTKPTNDTFCCDGE